jgi:hypothetical protein
LLGCLLRKVCSVCFEGSLDDFSIQDVLQIVSLGRKSGYLSLDTPTCRGAIIFRRGRILASVEDDEPLVAPGRRGRRREPRNDAVRARLAAFVERLSRCRLGEFRFEAADEAMDAAAGPEPRSVSILAGIDVVELLIDVASRANGKEGDPGSPDAERRLAG